jgi:signal transduction histidine kinase
VPAIASDNVLDGRAHVHATAPRAPRRRRRLIPRWTLRLRLTLLYGAMFLLAGTVLLAITYGLVAQRVGQVTVAGKNALIVSGGTDAIQVPIKLPAPVPGAELFYAQAGGSGAELQLRDYGKQVKSATQATIRRVAAADQARLAQFKQKATSQLDHQRSAQLGALLTKSGFALGIMALISVGLGWLMAGRALRPVRTMSARARGISERNLHERLALEGPNDELKELGDTVDGLLGRLERAFESQRRFVANASHELRTPITLSRTLVEVALADPHPSVGSLHDTCRRVLAAGEQQERLIAALLTLARSQRGLDRCEQLDLGAIAETVLLEARPGTIKLESELGDAPATGDPALIERLTANLVDNALRYNQAHGWVRTWTGMVDGQPTLEVTNTGRVVPADQLDTLVEPFRRLDGERSNGSRGLGLGLSIVEAIATAHGAELSTVARGGGGLQVRVTFPARLTAPLHS